jgi:hypothetical protein
MTQMVGLAVLTFMVGVSFMFWLGGIAANEQETTSRLDEADEPREPGVRPQESVDG